jgi:hypothetical protein
MKGKKKWKILRPQQQQHRQIITVITIMILNFSESSNSARKQSVLVNEFCDCHVHFKFNFYLIDILK